MGNVDSDRITPDDAVPTFRAVAVAVEKSMGGTSRATYA